MPVRRFFSAGSFLIRPAINQPRFRDTYRKERIVTRKPREKLEQNVTVSWSSTFPDGGSLSYPGETILQNLFER